MLKNKTAGQSLIELVIGVTLGALIIGGVSASVFVGMRSNLYARQELVAAQLAQRTINYVQSSSEANWNVVYKKNKGPNHPYYATPSGDGFAVLAGTNTAAVDQVTYTYFFWIENVARDGSGAIVSSGGTDDPSTQKISVQVRWESLGSLRETVFHAYLMRTRNNSSRFTDWSLGPGQEGPVTSPNRGFSSSANTNHSSIPGVVRISGF